MNYMQNYRLMQLIEKRIHDFKQNQNDNYPFQPTAFLVVKQVHKSGEVSLNDFDGIVNGFISRAQFEMFGQ